jgi:hypothetical protein
MIPPDYEKIEMKNAVMIEWHTVTGARVVTSRPPVLQVVTFRTKNL